MELSRQRAWCQGLVEKESHPRVGSAESRSWSPGKEAQNRAGQQVSPSRLGLSKGMGEKLGESLWSGLPEISSLASSVFSVKYGC